MAPCRQKNERRDHSFYVPLKHDRELPFPRHKAELLYIFLNLLLQPCFHVILWTARPILIHRPVQRFDRLLCLCLKNKKVLLLQRLGWHCMHHLKGGFHSHHLSTLNDFWLIQSAPNLLSLLLKTLRTLTQIKLPLRHYSHYIFQEWGW